MKSFRSFLLLAAIVLLASPAVSAQSASQKTRLAEIRKAYSDAMALATKNQAAATKNTQVFQAGQTDANGVWNHKIEFVYDLDYVEELDFYAPRLVFIRQNTGGYLQEFLFDEECELMFVFERPDPGEEDETMEFRYYYDTQGAPFWKIEKEVEVKSKKVLSTTEGPVEESDGSAWFLTRVANDLVAAFDALNVMYD